MRAIAGRSGAGQPNVVEKLTDDVLDRIDATLGNKLSLPRQLQAVVYFSLIGHIPL